MPEEDFHFRCQEDLREEYSAAVTESLADFDTEAGLEEKMEGLEIGGEKWKGECKMQRIAWTSIL